MVVDPQFARRRDGLPLELAREGRDILLHALGEGDHLLARGGESVAGPMALEELHAEPLLELAEAAEHGGMVDPEPFGGPPEAVRLGDGLDEPEVIPGEMLQRGHRPPPLHWCNATNAPIALVLQK